MTLFDDTTPNERKELITILRQAVPLVPSVTAEEQSQMLTRVRARLQQSDLEELSNDAPPIRHENLDRVRELSLLQDKALPRFRRIRSFLNLVAAVIIVGVLIGASFLLFSSRYRAAKDTATGISTGGVAGAIKTPVMLQSQAGGLETVLRITSGPYFVSELLSADITFTNHSKKDFVLVGSARLNSCNAAVSITITGNDEPHYNLPVSFPTSINCPFAAAQLGAGKTLTIHGYVTLTHSGQVTLTEGARFFTVKKDSSGQEERTPGTSPLDGHWPTISINVMAKIPVDRIISLQRRGSQIAIDYPAQSELVYFYTLTCGKVGSTNGQWTSLATKTLQKPGLCAGATWTYAVGAPGYAIASGEMSS